MKVSLRELSVGRVDACITRWYRVIVIPTMGKGRSGAEQACPVRAQRFWVP